MKARTRVLSLLGLFLVLIAVLLPAGRALAQSQEESGPSGAQTALAGGIMLVFAVVGLAFYVYLSLAVQTIANKTHTENSWMAWIPIVNLFLLLNIAKKPAWWFVLFLIPVVSLVMVIIVWMAVAEARGKPSWWGILLIVPLVGLIVPGYLAWSD
jgi:Family of unknown function (DUF5684)